MEELKKIKLDLVELKSRPVNVGLVEQDEVETVNVLLSKKEEKDDLMIVDLGAPCSMVGKNWLEKYVADHGVNVKDLKTEECIKKF